MSEFYKCEHGQAVCGFCLKMLERQYKDVESERDRLRAQNEELVKVSTLAKIQLNAIANELKSDFNLAHDNMASNACWLAETIEQALKSAEVK